ncbi:MAG: hypothetical protein AAF571_10810 [Verrucomicrobiota bacterium]
MLLLAQNNGEFEHEKSLFDHLLSFGLLGWLATLLFVAFTLLIILKPRMIDCILPGVFLPFLLSITGSALGLIRYLSFQLRPTMGHLPPVEEIAIIFTSFIVYGSALTCLLIIMWIITKIIANKAVDPTPES